MEGSSCSVAFIIIIIIKVCRLDGDRWEVFVDGTLHIYGVAIFRIYV